MKFISKSSNLLIVLRAGLSAQPITGTPAKPTVSVRFKDGVADVQQQELVDMMLAHPAFNADFISADSVAVDPYLASRIPSEPTHVLTELKYGTPTAREVKGGAVTLPPELQKMVATMASDMAKAMLPQMIESTLKGIISANESAKAAAPAAKVKGKPGRKPKVHTTEVIQASNPALQEAV